MNINIINSLYHAYLPDSVVRIETLSESKGTVCDAQKSPTLVQVYHNDRQQLVDLQAG